MITKSMMTTMSMTLMMTMTTKSIIIAKTTPIKWNKIYFF